MKEFKGDVDYLTCGPSFYNDKTQNVMIYEGLPMVAYKNIQKEHIFNSEVFYVKSIDMDHKTFTFDVGDEVKTFKADEFKNIFYPAYCVTVHVSQGCSIREKFTIHDWNNHRMNMTAKYVALSRATSINNIQINI